VSLQAEQLRHAKDEVRPLAVHVGLHGRASACTDIESLRIFQ
jgi:hypothetical protein